MTSHDTALSPVFPEELLQDLSDDRLESARQLSEVFVTWYQEKQGSQSDRYLALIDAYAHAKAIAEARDWPTFGSYEIVGDLSSDVGAIKSQFDNLATWARRALLKRRAEDRFNKAQAKYAGDPHKPFEYRFKKSELERVQHLVNEIRTALTGLEGVHEGWKRRMLKRLEALQNELHERMGTMDRFWGIVGEALPVLHAAGVAAKPLVNRLREVAEIGLRVQATFYGFPPPPGIPLLPPSEEDPPLAQVESRHQAAQRQVSVVAGTAAL